ncbi:MAG: hypothetical protein ACK4F0_07930 [Candidatus Ratteibacteria bacterium]
MGRKRIDKKIEAEVLFFSRRRCCICYGLNRNFSMKQGQIAHLDHNPNNNDFDNLAFLCLEHHDLYDAKFGLSKGFMIEEVKLYREELYNFIKNYWSLPVLLGEIEINMESVEGFYIRDGIDEYAELEVIHLTDEKIRLKGYAFWGTNNIGGPHIGELDFECELKDRIAVYSEKFEWEERPYWIRLVFTAMGVKVEERNVVGHFGMNVSFAGEYVRIKRRTK